MQGDAHLLLGFLATDCLAEIRRVPAGDGLYGLVSTPGVSGAAPDEPFVTTTERAGYETPRGRPLARLLIGGGTILSNHGVLPLAVASAGVGTRGKTLRLLVEWQYAVSTVSTELRRSLRRPSDDFPVAVDTVRAGVEVPLRR